jgi:hypothetical protein
MASKGKTAADYTEVEAEIDGRKVRFHRLIECPESPDEILTRKYPEAEERTLLSDSWEPAKKEEKKEKDKPEE